MSLAKYETILGRFQRLEKGKRKGGVLSVSRTEDAVWITFADGTWTAHLVRDGELSTARLLYGSQLVQMGLMTKEELTEAEREKSEYTRMELKEQRRKQWIALCGEFGTPPSPVESIAPEKVEAA